MTAHTIVVGGTKGIGRAIVQRLSAAGARVSIIGRTSPDWASAMSGVVSCAADAADPPALAGALADAVRANGSATSAVLVQRFRGEEDDWAGEIATSVTATRDALEWSGEHLVDGGAGKAVVVIGSAAASFVASEQPVSYHMAKAAITQLVRYYAVTLGPRGVRVNAIAPGTTVKEESKSFYRDHPDLDRLYRDVVPLGRMGTADDVADLVQFLLSDRASFLTGQNIALDGGVSLVWQEALARRLSPLKDLQVTKPKPR